jgi:hypothetical protein
MSGSSFSELHGYDDLGLQRVLLAFIVYAILVLAAEISFGNPKFIFNLWTFETIAPWKWSMPVHLMGFLWILLANAILKDKPMIFAIMGSVLFFFAAETLNAFVFTFFVYSDRFCCSAFSFWTIVVQYFCLCALCSFILRRKT